MPLNKSALKAAIKSGYEAAQAEQDPALAADAIAGAIADAIEIFVKSGTVSFAAGTVTGATPANGSLTGGAATNGLIS